MRAQDFLSEVTPKLRITPEHLSQAKDGKFQMVVEFPVDSFLKMTTGKDDEIDQIMNSAQTVLTYNKAAKSGKNILMPFLIIDQDRGQIIAHEGRHRAAAMKKGGAKTIPVAIQLDPGRDLEKKYPNEYGLIYKARFEDLPNVIKGQFGRGNILSNDLKSIIDGWENM